jgi:surface protein
VANVTTMEGMFRDASSFNQPLEQWNVTNVTTMYGMFSYASAFCNNAEGFAHPLWARGEVGDQSLYLERWKILYKEAKRFKAVVIGEHARADRPKTDGSAAGVAVGAVAQVLTMRGLAEEIESFLLCCRG